MLYHIHALCHIRLSITDDVFKIIACSMVGCHLDYAKSVFIGASTSVQHKLERIPEHTGSSSNSSTWSIQHLSDTSQPALAANQMENQFQSRYTNI